MGASPQACDSPARAPACSETDLYEGSRFAHGSRPWLSLLGRFAPGSPARRLALAMVPGLRSTGMTAAGRNNPPVIIGCQRRQVAGKKFRISGTVTDETPAACVVVFSGAANAYVTVRRLRQLQRHLRRAHARARPRPSPGRGSAAPHAGQPEPGQRRPDHDLHGRPRRRSLDRSAGRSPTRPLPGWSSPSAARGPSTGKRPSCWPTASWCITVNHRARVPRQRRPPR